MPKKSDSNLGKLIALLGIGALAYFAIKMSMDVTEETEENMLDTEDTENDEVIEDVEEVKPKKKKNPSQQSTTNTTSQQQTTSQTQSTSQQQTTNTTSQNATPEKTILPRQTSTLTDMGYLNNLTPGFPLPDWYDVTGQGVNNDYCREVGNQPPNSVWACAMAGGTDQYVKVDINDPKFKDAKRVATKQVADKIKKALIKSQVRDNYCIDISAYNKENMAKIQGWDCHGGENQRFDYDPATKQLKTQYGRCLDVIYSSKDDMAQVIQYDCHGGDNQKWDIREHDDKTISFISKNSGKCLDLLYSGKENGTQVQQYSCNGTAAQKFTIG